MSDAGPGGSFSLAGRISASRLFMSFVDRGGRGDRGDRVDRVDRFFVERVVFFVDRGYIMVPKSFSSRHNSGHNSDHDSDRDSDHNSDHDSDHNSGHNSGHDSDRDSDHSSDSMHSSQNLRILSENTNFFIILYVFYIKIKTLC